MSYHPVDGHSNLFKDPKTGVLVSRANTDRSRYQIAKRQARQAMESQYEISQLKREVKELGELKGEINDLKQMIQMLLDK